MADLSDLPPLREVIDIHDLRAKKSLGQNFLLDLNITRKITRLSGDLSGLNIVEIGPGPGGLTRALIESDTKSITAIEYDSRAVAALGGLVKASKNKLKIIEADALKVDVLKIIEAPRGIIANLPYNIATPLLIGWLRQLAINNYNYKLLSLMFQKEVGQRIVARYGDKHYGRLSIISQWLCDVDILLDLPPQAFTPPPKVKSCVVRFLPKNRSDTVSFQTMESLTEKAFGQRRKMIRQSLKPYTSFFSQLGLNPEMRPQDMSVQDFVNIAECVEKEGL